MRLSEITYDLIQPLIVSEEIEGRQVHCQFALPGSDEIHEASAGIKRSRGVGSTVQRQVKRNMVYELRRTATSMLRGIFGSGFLGRTARQAMNTASRDASRNATQAPSAEEKKDAVLDAFKRVASKFHYDEATSKWTLPGFSATGGGKAEVLSPFQAHLKENPITNKYQKSILARLLVQVAYADGDVAEEEVEFFQDSIPEEYGTITSLAGAEPVSKLEAEEIQKNVRETILMLAWSIASIDMDVADSESFLLNKYADVFGIPAAKATELSNMAKANVLEGYFTDEITRPEIFELADKIGLNHEDAERAKIRWMKRQ